MSKKFLALGLIVSLVSSAWGTSNYVVAETSANQVYEGKQGAGKEIEEQGLTTDEIPDALGLTENEKKDITDKYTKRLYNEERNLNTVMFENEDGERTMYMFKHPVKFEDENGNIVDKDVHFEELGDECGIRIKKRYICDNGDNDVKVYMPNSITYGINIETDENSIEMAVDESYNRDAEVIIDDNYVTYDEVFGEGTSVKYTPLLNGIKEEIILEEFTGQTEFDFTLRLDGYELVTLDDNCLYLENKENSEIEGIIDSVYMIDANGETNFNNYYTYEELADGYYKITAHVNEEFLKDENTVYPVTIDPTVTLEKSKSTTAILDATLNSTSTTAGASGSLFVGNRSNTENGISRAVMKFPGLNFDTLKVSVVIEAKVSLRDIMCESQAMTVDCYPLDIGYPWWTESSVNWSNMGMSSFKANTDNILDSNAVSYSQGVKFAKKHRYEFDITDEVMAWRAGDTTGMSRGILFVSHNENQVISKTFASYNRASNNPVFEMKYVPYGGGKSWDEYKCLYNDARAKGFNPNCLGLAFYSIYDVTPLITDLDYMVPVEYSNVYALASKIAAYVNRQGEKSSLYASAEIVGYGLSSVEQYMTARGSLGDKEHLIAVRMNTEDTVIAFHVIVQTSNGSWVQKQSTLPPEYLGYINPDDSALDCWDAGAKGRFNSVTVYIKMTLN